MNKKELLRGLWVPPYYSGLSKGWVKLYTLLQPEVALYRYPRFRV